MILSILKKQFITTMYYFCVTTEGTVIITVNASTSKFIFIHKDDIIHHPDMIYYSSLMFCGRRCNRLEFQSQLLAFNHIAKAKEISKLWRKQLNWS